jgi:hypothetical protein
LDGVLADISFEMRAISWSSSEIIGEAGEVIDIVGPETGLSDDYLK